MIRRRPATGLPDHVVERIVAALVQLEGALDLADATAILFSARRHHARGATGWPGSPGDVARELERIRRRRLLAPVMAPDPVFAAMRSTAPTGAA